MFIAFIRLSREDIALNVAFTFWLDADTVKFLRRVRDVHGFIRNLIFVVVVSNGRLSYLLKIEGTAFRLQSHP